MRSFPTRPALDLVIAGSATTLAGVLLFQPAVVAWGGALLIGLSLSRALTVFSVSRVRASGFEMVWCEPQRSLRMERGQMREVWAQVRNRDQRAIVYAHLRALASPNLEVSIEPASGEVPAGSSCRVCVRVLAQRVGRHGIYGLALELRGRPGYFEVPLTFSNAYGVEVMPGPAPQVGARGRLGQGAVLHGSRRSRRAGDAAELSELRDHQSGDSLRRVAWKASARRGKLLVRKLESEERDVLWILLDAAVELWAGRVGLAPLDVAIDSAARLARQHLARGHRVGLAIVDGNATTVPPGRGRGQERRVLEALSGTPGVLDAERSALGEAQVAAKVLEHARALMPGQARRVASADLDSIAGLARRGLSLSPFPDSTARGTTPRDSLLRGYLAAFGVTGPPRLAPRDPRVDEKLMEVLSSVTSGRAKATLTYVVSPLPGPERQDAIAERLARLSPRRVKTIRWLYPPLALGVPNLRDTTGRMTRLAAELRERSGRRSAEERLRRHGIVAIPCRIERADPPGGEGAP